MINSVLVVEDDEGIRKYLRELLIENSYSVKTASDGASALNKIEKSQPNLVLLDLMLPDISGETLCKKIKKDYPEIAVIILTAKSAVNNIVEGLDIGADDYITKPFESVVLLARIRAQLRENIEESDKLEIADLSMNLKTYEVKRDGRLIKLTPQEFKLLEYLIRNKNQVLTREMILGRIWSSSPDIETRVVDVYIGYLRKKIDLKNKKKLIHSKRGFGYMIKEI